MTAAEIRERFLAFFEARGHLRVPSSSLVPASYDPSVLLTTAGMQQFKPYFRGEEEPPSPRLTSCQKTFRTVDIEVVGTTARHLTFFEMLGNFSVGDYFKQGASEFAWEFSTQGLKLDPERIWITVFGGDDEFGLGPDAEAIEVWRAIGIPDDRIVLLGREDNFWQSGPTGPCGPCSELYLDRGPAFGADSERPGDDTERYLEYWNLVFMQYELHSDGSLTPLPQQNIDTGLGLDRMAAIQQDVPSIYETEHFRPLLEFGEQRSGRRYGQDEQTTRSLRVLADHGRGAAFLMADGVVPSNEERGYVLRRILRRAIRHGRTLGIEGSFVPGLCDVVVEGMGDVYPELRAERQTIARWATAEEEGFSRTLSQGERLLADLIESARASGANEVSAEDAFQLHDTYGFPFEMTQEVLAEEGLTVDDQGFAALMEQARDRARSGARATGGDQTADRAAAFARQTGFSTRFVGFESTMADTVARAVQSDNGTQLVKLEDSPFYPAGGGQVSDAGVVRTGSAEARVAEVFRLGSDQVLALEPGGALTEGDEVHAEVDRPARLATMRNHTATHLLHAALRERLGDHVRQAGSYVGPDKLRFDFTHGERLSQEELADVERRVNGWIADNEVVTAVETTLDEARSLGAMALFGEKYGDWVRMVEVERVSRELCGGTHVATTGEIGLFHMTVETSSASNVRRIEAVTGPGATALFEQRTAQLRRLSEALRAPEGELDRAVEKLNERVRALSKRPAAAVGGTTADELVKAAEEVSGVPVVSARAEVGDAKELLGLADRVRQTLGDSVVVLGAAPGERVYLVVNVAPAVVERGVKAGDVVKAAAEVVGGGGGGRDTMAQAGGRLPEKLDDALRSARMSVEQSLS